MGGSTLLLPCIFCHFRSLGHLVFNQICFLRQRPISFWSLIHGNCGREISRCAKIKPSTNSSTPLLMSYPPSKLFFSLSSFLHINLLSLSPQKKLLNRMRNTFPRKYLSLVLGVFVYICVIWVIYLRFFKQNHQTQARKKLKILKLKENLFQNFDRGSFI